ncbi:hypothetical protein WJX72_001330 [[Myrmecia] bisecta]|uniref:CBF1-interacting co-repressor CIR N-terminal domain-containing protein n=1 Tax=[Myrmecia] bisecta TaxID=41462 RepID=A0AAW1QEP8_9CHLO
MGGHGGLNILPQKSWNVYGRENRLKVARDEAKYEEEERVKREKHTEAERAYRHKLLLQRARGTDQAVDTSSDALPSTSAVVEAAEPAPPAKPQHINFFEEQEARDMHPDVKEEKKAERRRRGDPDTQTSDARFDERFKLGFGLYEPANQPWYSKSGSTLPTEADRGQDGNGEPGGLGLPAAAEPPLPLQAPKMYDKQAHKKSRHKEKKRKKDKLEADGKVHKQSGKKSLAELRGERQQREAAEALRQRNVLLGKAADTLNDGVNKGTKRYHSAFGFAPDRRRRA